MVHDPDQLADVFDARVFQIVIHIDREVCGPVVAHEVIELDGMDLIRVHLGEPGGSRHDLFRNGHSHNKGGQGTGAV